MISRKRNVKSLVSACVICTLCFIILGGIFFRLGPRIVYTQTKSEAMRLAQNAASDLDGDAFASIDSQESPGFKYVYDQLSKYKTYESIIFIYSMKKLEDGELVFVVDTDEEDPADIFEPYEWLESIVPAFNGQVCSDEEFTSDEWGTYLSGYAPIYDSTEEIVGIVGCDISIDTINRRLLNLRILIMILGVIPNAVMIMIFESKTPDSSRSL